MIALDHAASMQLLGYLTTPSIGEGTAVVSHLKRHGVPDPIHSTDDHVDDPSVRAVARILSGTNLYDTLLPAYVWLRSGIEVRYVGLPTGTPTVLDTATDEVVDLVSGETYGLTELLKPSDSKYGINATDAAPATPWGRLTRVTPGGVWLTKYGDVPATVYETIALRAKSDPYGPSAPSRRRLLSELVREWEATSERDAQALALALVTGVTFSVLDGIAPDGRSSRYGEVVVTDSSMDDHSDAEGAPVDDDVWQLLVAVRDGEGA